MLQGLLLASLNLAARCSQEPKLARLSASCIEHACEGAVTASMDIPQNVISGLVQAVQAQSSDAEVRLLHLLVILCFPMRSPFFVLLSVGYTCLSLAAAIREHSVTSSQDIRWLTAAC